jgi:hypothetical protein
MRSVYLANRSVASNARAFFVFPISFEPSSTRFSDAFEDSTEQPQSEGLFERDGGRIHFFGGMIQPNINSQQLFQNLMFLFEAKYLRKISLVGIQAI